MKEESIQTENITKEFSVDALNKALFDFEDIMERAMCPFLVLGQTAIDIKDGFKLRGSKVEVGVKSLCLTKMVLSTIKTYKGIDVDRDNDKEITYEVDGVPVICKIIRKKWKFLENPQMVFYWGGDYQLPNPMSEYLKARYIIK
jgi:hypothetical protein